MSVPHHSEAELEAAQRFISEMLGEAKPHFPQGKLNERDDGELAFAVAADLRKRVVILRFAKPVDWLGMPAKQTRDLANLLLEKATQVEASCP